MGGLDTPGIPDLDYYVDLSERFPVQEETLASSVILADLTDIADVPAVEPVESVEAEEIAEVDISELGRGLEDEVPVESLLDGIEEEPEPVVAEVNVDSTEDNVLSYFSYRVKSGDTISEIATRYDITTDTIISVNNIKSSRTIPIGQYLKIPNQKGILYTVKTDGETPATIAQKYSVDANKVALANNLQENSSLSAGRTVFVTDAKMDRIALLEINGDLFKNPLHSSYYISSRFGWRVSPFDSSKRTYHGGIDMACPTGTPIYAASEGEVITAGWSNVYGNYVIVSHHSGYKTLYGHMSSILVTKGQYVYTTTKIGKVGSTGQSTGPHLHFTVYKNGNAINPELRVELN
ncbi:MAG: M23 family metallopeptidase [Treponema sp.]|nr:M23 family metallopeptidase [Treponema sp.]